MAVSQRIEQIALMLPIDSSEGFTVCGFGWIISASNITVVGSVQTGFAGWRRPDSLGSVIGDSVYNQRPNPPTVLSYWKKTLSFL